MALRNIPHPGEGAKRPSRRTQHARSAQFWFLHALFRGTRLALPPRLILGRLGRLDQWRLQIRRADRQDGWARVPPSRRVLPVFPKAELTKPNSDYQVEP